MTEEPGAHEPPSEPRGQPAKSVHKLQFGEDRTFQKELLRRVDEYLRAAGRPQHDAWQMYLKTAIVLGCFVASYVLLVFVAQTAWQGVILAVMVGLSMAGIGFNIQHDGGHKSYSKHPWVNKLMAMTLDLVGGSSYVWRWKHAVIHHNDVNITGYDTDIELSNLGRLSPHQRRLWFHRWQHLYLWPLYGFLAVRWEFLDDFRNVIQGRIGPHPMPRPKGWDLVVLIAGKAVFFSWALVIPMLFHPVGVVLFYYLVAIFVLGLLISVVFQLPHAVGGADFPLPIGDTGRMANPWAVHQAQVTLDFGRRNPILTWPLGGLNFHREHHLFPMLCHVNYPAISKIVDETCREFGVKCAEHSGFWAGVAEHYRWLRQMGLPSADE